MEEEEKMVRASIETNFMMFLPHLFFYSPRHDETENLNVLGLPYTKGATDCLSIDGWVPNRAEENHSTRPYQIQPQTSYFDRYQHDSMTIPVSIKFLKVLFAQKFVCSAINAVATNATSIQDMFQEVKMLHPWRENYCL